MLRSQFVRSSVVLAASTMHLYLLIGCQTLSSVGLPVSSSTYRLSSTARQISQSHTRAAAIPRELSPDVLDVYIVEPGDVLYLEAAKFDSPMRLPGDQPVQPDGSIELGKYGRLRVAGMTLPQIRDAVQAAIDAREEIDWLQQVAERGRPTDENEAKQRANEEREWREAREVVVRLVDWESKVFYVMGEVNSPGAYPFTGNENVLDALVAAGDITQKADRHHIILSRPTGPCDRRFVLPICYDNIVQLADTSSNYQIMPGDRIFIPSISLADDIVQSLVPRANERCPLCGPPQRGAPIPKVDCSELVGQNCQ